jgi:hypothetical protein
MTGISGTDVSRRRDAEKKRNSSQASEQYRERQRLDFERMRKQCRNLDLENSRLRSENIKLLQTIHENMAKINVQKTEYNTLKTEFNAIKILLLKKDPIQVYINNPPISSTSTSYNQQFGKQDIQYSDFIMSPDTNTIKDNLPSVQKQFTNSVDFDMLVDNDNDDDNVFNFNTLINFT